VRVLIDYPPLANPYLPYSAPFVLKAYVESVTPHRVRTSDSNLDYHAWLWTGGFGASATREAKSRAALLLAEGARARGPEAYDALRTRSTFARPALVATYASLLHSVHRVVRTLDRQRGATSCEALPRSYGEWPALVDGLARGVLGGFLSGRVASGAYDGYEVVGLCTAYLEQLLPALLLAREIKRRSPTVRIVLGGGAVTHFVDDLKRDPSFFEAVDAVVPFEGEHTFAALLERYAAGAAPPPDVLHRDGARVAYRKNLHARPNVMAFPDFSDLEDRYPTPALVHPVLTAKGCYWGKCTYCTHHEGYGQGYYNFADAEVGNFLRGLTERGARYFYLVDEALPPRKLRELAGVFGQLSARGEDGGWMSEARVDRPLTTPDAVDALARSGCKLLVSGVESGSQSILDRMKKGIDVDLVELFARRCRDAGIMTGWMFFVGYPGETEEQALETIRMIERNADVVDFVGIGSFTLDRGAPIHLAPREHGLHEILEEDRPYAIGYDYVDSGGRKVSAREPGARLERLLGQHPSLRPLLQRAVARGLAMFLDRTAVPEPAPVLTWTSRDGSEVRFAPLGKGLVTRRPLAEEVAS
jgi:hypothetical protein